MNKEEVYKYLKEKHNRKNCSIWKPEKFWKMFPEIQEEFNVFISKSHLQDINFRQQLWHFFNGIASKRKCDCGNNLRFISFYDGYVQFCSAHCPAANAHHNEMMRKTLSEKSDEEKKKTIEKIKETKLKKYGSANYNNRIKSQETCLKKYGRKTFMETDEFKEKTKETSLTRWGVEAPCQSDEVKEKILKTSVDRHGGMGYGSNKTKEKARATMSSRYGAKTT